MLQEMSRSNRYNNQQSTCNHLRVLSLFPTGKADTADNAAADTAEDSDDSDDEEAALRRLRRRDATTIHTAMLINSSTASEMPITNVVLLLRKFDADDNDVLSTSSSTNDESSSVVDIACSVVDGIKSQRNVLHDSILLVVGHRAPVIGVPSLVSKKKTKTRDHRQTSCGASCDASAAGAAHRASAVRPLRHLAVARWQRRRVARALVDQRAVARLAAISSALNDLARSHLLRAFWWRMIGTENETKSPIYGLTFTTRRLARRVRAERAELTIDRTEAVAEFVRRVVLAVARFQTQS
jgi:hypothetical protein